MTEAEIHANYERAIMPQVEGLIATIVRQEGEIERLRAQRDALLGLCVAELHAQAEMREHGYTHIGFEGWSEPDGEEDDGQWATEAVAICRRSRDEAIAAVRRAAGIGSEAAPR
jgi:hypothetical protein